MKYLTLSIATVFSSTKPKQRELTPHHGKKEPITEMDDWAKLLRDMQHPDAEVRAKAQAKWTDKKQRDQAFFAGVPLSNATPPEHRGRPLSERNGWRAEDEKYLPQDDWCDDVLRVDIERQKPLVDHHADAIYKDSVERGSSEELDKEFYGTHPRNISKEDIEKSIDSARRLGRPEDGEG